MTKQPGMFLTLSVVLLAALTGWQANTAQAQDDSGFMDRVSGSVGVDFTNEYYFRGIAQENQGFIAQPWAELGVALYENDNSGEVIDTIGLTFGVWNSIHDGPSGSSGAPNDAFYEFDAYVGVAVGLLDVWEVSGQYQVLNSPSNAFATTQEFSFGVAYDDSELLGDWAVSPYITIIVETDGGADAGGDLGTYLELGIEKSWTVVESETWPVTFTIPVTIGFSLDNYYEDAFGKDSTFGYVDVGFVFGVPLEELIPSQFGAWELSVGVHLLALGDSTNDIAERDSAVDGNANLEVIGVIGISAGF